MRIANSFPILKVMLVATKFLGRYSSRLSGAIAYLLWFIPWRVPVSERGLQKQARWLEPTRPFTLRTSVGRVAGFTAGEGPLVMLVHGWGDRAAGLGGFIAPLSDAGFKVVGFDLLAHGDSERQMTNPIESATVLREVADHLGGAYGVIAHSLGATAALWAMKDGLAVTRAVLIAPNVEMAYAMGSFEAMFGLPPKAIAGLKRKLERRFGANIWHELRGDNLVSHVTTPGLICHDPDDPQVPFEGSTRLIHAWRGSRLIEAPGLGHGGITRDPSVIEQAVAFITEPAQDPRASRFA